MHTRQQVRADAPASAAREAYPSGTMRQAVLTALTALAACALVIAVGAGMSMCWAIHPLLTLAAFALVVWAGSRLAGLAFRQTRN